MIDGIELDFTPRKAIIKLLMAFLICATKRNVKVALVTDQQLNTSTFGALFKCLEKRMYLHPRICPTILTASKHNFYNLWCLKRWHVDTPRICMPSFASHMM